LGILNPRFLLDPFDLAVDVPDCFFQIFDFIAFIPGSPDVLDGISPAEIHVLCYLDRLNPRGVFAVVGRMIYGIVLLTCTHCFPLCN
jgi:hypothetical protein